MNILLLYLITTLYTYDIPDAFLKLRKIKQFLIFASTEVFLFHVLC